MLAMYEDSDMDPHSPSHFEMDGDNITEDGREGTRTDDIPNVSSVIDDTQVSCLVLQLSHTYAYACVPWLYAELRIPYLSCYV